MALDGIRAAQMDDCFTIETIDQWSLSRVITRSLLTTPNMFEGQSRLRSGLSEFAKMRKAEEVFCRGIALDIYAQRR